MTNIQTSLNSGSPSQHNGASRMLSPYRTFVRFKKQRSDRRGVLLLIVLSMLTLFMMLGTAFFVLASRARVVAKAFSDTQLFDQRDQRRAQAALDHAMMLLLRGPGTPGLPITDDDSLLGDKYGVNTIVSGTITQSAVVPILNSGTANGLFHRFLFATTTAPANATDLQGRILTITDGDSRGESLRVILSTSAAAASTFSIVALAENPAAVKLADGDLCFVNAREFSGSSSDANEDWDAPDENNWFLAWAQPEASERDSSGSLRYKQPWKSIIPSFHRPDLIQASVSSGAFVAGNVRRPFGKFGTAATSPPANSANWFQSFIPTSGVAITGSATHPDFTGSNISKVATQNGFVDYFFDPVNGPWDVDNDGDGVSDSVWLDLGFPFQQLDDGTIAKPLFAIMCLDLDGRINLNCHVNPYEIWSERPSPFESPSSGQIPSRSISATEDTLIGSGTSYANPSQPFLPKGLGFGPAGVDASVLLRRTTAAGPDANMAVFTEGTPAEVLNTTPRVTATGARLPVGGFVGLLDSGTPVPGVPSVRSPREVLTQRGITSGTGSLSTGASLVDLWERTFVGVNRWGMPHFLRFGASSPPLGRAGFPASSGITPWGSENTNTPYSARPSASMNAPGGYPFTLPALEACLRYADRDSSNLPQRLRRLLGEDLERLRTQVTVESWDTTAITVPDAILSPLIALASGTASGPVPERLNSLLSWEISLGQKMNLNRPFGDGVDNNGNGVCDEPIDDPVLTASELRNEGSSDPLILTGDSYVRSGVSVVPGLTNGRDVDQDGTIDINDQAMARQLYARHLYCLAYYFYESILGITITDGIANELAQWAVNVVDFRDADSIMTSFEYDLFPFVDNQGADGKTWDVDGDLTSAESNTFRRVVWGAERPELLITEVLAWNDAENNNGGVIVELYNPWRASAGTADASGTHLIQQQGTADRNPIPAGKELLRAADDPFSMDTGIDLLKTVPSASSHPVWMIAYNANASPLSSGTTAPYPASPQPGDNIDSEAMTALYYLSSVKPDNNIIALHGSAGHYVKNAVVTHRTVPPGRFGVIASGIDFGNTPTDFAIPVGIPTPASAPLSKGVEVALNTKVITAAGLGSPAPVDADNLGACIVCDADTSDAAGLARLPSLAGAPPRQIYLCRLANPLAPWDEDTNPYRVVDLKTIHPVEIDAGAALPAELQQSERGAANFDGNIWKANSAHVNGGRHTGTAPTAIQWSLGKLQFVAVPDFDPARKDAKTAPMTSASGNPLAPINPTNTPPVPWLVWNNRDFANPHELLYVPKASAANFLALHDVDPDNAHTHMLFAPTASGAQFATLANNENIALLEFVATPTQFALVDSWLHPTLASRPAASTTASPLFLPPHNRLPAFREPGRVNVNTINSSDVWQAINGGATHIAYRDEQDVDELALNPTLLPFRSSEDISNTTRPRNWRLDVGEDLATAGSAPNGFLDLNDDLNNDGVATIGTSTLAHSRRGYAPDVPAAPPANTVNCDFVQAERVLSRHGIASASDRFFGAPFQSSLSGGTPPALANTLFWRPSGVGPNVFGLDFTPLPGQAHPATDPDRNQFFRYRTVNKLANTVTTRSNVFAVWITVGYFTADPNDPTNLGDEVGFESGEIVRHKAFFIVDRSIPVGFEPGKDHNARNCIVLQRFVQ